ncbi:hypothetical protein GH714_036227 [Hevea brasiliensis]|uniref:Protein kinase domain-containing protein n=1 Tax=Hevea brasiliensis TaxID=3981 RepID=A0A6A6NEM8_HEVBR|nr:hypothetical protein GH714_036227 [Hevea brasiliensis]
MALDWLLRPVFLVFILIFILQFTSTSSKSDSETLIKLKNSFTNASALSSWVPGSAPCGGDAQWKGLLCSNGNVMGLRLENMGLSGKIDVDALVDISGLRSVSFEHNSFSGSIPEFNRLGYLKNIYLTGNQFSGEIPAEFFSKMQSLKKVWLANNKFSGKIPPSVIHLSNLIELHLEDNQFSGAIPPSSFEGNADLCGEKIGKECNAATEAVAPGVFAKTIPMNISKNDASNFMKRGAGIITLAVMLLCVAAVIIFKMRRKEDDLEAGVQNNTDDEAVEAVEVQISMPVRQKEMELTKKPGSTRKGPSSAKGGVGELVVMNNEKGVFGLTDLMKAAAEVLGNGGLGSSYKALLANGVAVVVKRLREMNALGRDGFDAEMRMLGRLKHANILPPLAFHFRKDEKLLIYEYIPKGSLLYLLHGDKGASHSELNWPTRLKIVQGIARGLGYLHTELASCALPHGNLKSSNVLLSPDNEPLLSDFGYNTLANPSVVGQALLPIRPQKLHNLGGIDLVQWAETKISEGKEYDMLDPEIASSSNSVGEMRQLIHIGALCAASNPVQRLDLREAIQRIEMIKLESVAVDSRTVQFLPSLGDGHADAPQFNASSSPQDGYVQNSTKGYGSYSSSDSELFSFDSPNSNLGNDKVK